MDLLKAPFNLSKALPKETAGEVYKDLVKPSAQSIGKTAGSLAEAVGLITKPIEWAVYGFDIIDKNVKEGLKKKLSKANLEDISTPDNNIIIPAYEALRYNLDKEELRNLYINLIANSADKSTQSNVHPCFVEIIKQLSTFDAVLLKKLHDYKLLNGILPACDIMFQNRKYNNGYVVYEKIISEALGCEVDNFEDYKSSLDNLERLQILKFYEGKLLKKEAYSGVVDGTIFSHCTNKLIIDFKDSIAEHVSSDLDVLPEHRDPEDYFIRLEEFSIDFTELGQRFINLCILDKEDYLVE